MHLPPKGEVVALIPARGGSKGIRHKNLAKLGGIPLLGWTIQAALEASTIDRVVVSTEDEQIREVAVSLGAEVPYLREPKLASDTADLRAVNKEASQELPRRGIELNALVTLLPTCPFRPPSLIDEVVSQSLRRSTPISVVAPQSWNPDYWFLKEGNHALPVRSDYGGEVVANIGAVHCTVRRLPRDGALSLVRYLADKAHDLRTADENQGVDLNGLVQLIGSIENDVSPVSGGRQPGEPFPKKFLYPVFDPHLLVDIDSSEDLLRAEEMLQAGLLPWTPPEVQVDTHWVPAQPKQDLPEKDELSLILSVHGEDRDKVRSAHTVSLHSKDLSSPYRLRTALNNQEGFQGKPLWFSSPESQLADDQQAHSLKDPTLSLALDHRLAINRYRLLHQIGVGFCSFNSKNHSFSDTIFQGLKIKVEQENIHIRFELPLQAGDTLSLDWVGEQPIRLLSRFQYFSDGEEWHYTIGSEQRSASVDQLSVVIPPRCSGAFVTCLRPADSHSAGSFYTAPLSVDGLIEFDRSTQSWKNQRTGKPITGRQQLPPIYRWGGRGYLPGEVQKESLWSFLPPY